MVGCAIIDAYAFWRRDHLISELLWVASQEFAVWYVWSKEYGIYINNRHRVLDYSYSSACEDRTTPL